MNLSRSRIIRWVAVGIALAALLLLIAGLPRVELDPGVPFAQILQFLIEQLGLGEQRMPRGVGTTDGGLLLDIYRIIFFVALAAFPIAIILIIMDPDLRKRVLRSTIRVLIIMALLLMILRNELTQSDEVPMEPLEGIPGQNMGELGEAYAPDTFAPETVSPWIERGLSLALALLVAAVIVVIVIRARRNRLESETLLEDIAFQARTALESIERGSNLRNVVQRCYAEMIRVVREQRGLRRDRAVTAREFTDYLIDAQLPRQPVNRLTALFERARYSDAATTAEDEEEALQSLRAIILACEELA
jgi:hypothetical protein